MKNKEVVYKNLAPIGELEDIWEITNPGEITWHVKKENHTDHIEMSGLQVSGIISYGVDDKGGLVLSREVVWPMLRLIPNDTHASLSHTFPKEVSPEIVINGVKIPTKKAELNFRHFLDSVSQSTNHDVVFNLDMTHNKRGGYFYLYEYGNIFLENRYTDWVNYYPYWTLRNLWQLSKYVPAEKLQIEFLNNQRSNDKYPDGDIFAPFNIPFDYTFAVTMMAQPLAWFEGSNLFEEGYAIAPLVEKYLDVQTEMHSGQIFPIGDEPSGRSWTGFQSILDESSGYVLIFREYNKQNNGEIKLYHAANKSFAFEKVLGYGESFKQVTNKKGDITFSLPEMNQFVLYKYSSN